MVVPEQYRTFWPRFWAGWVDFAVFIPFMLVDSWIEGSTKNTYFLAFWFVIYSLIADVYTIAMHASFGQTLGKMVTGVKVLDLSGGKLSLVQSTVRDSVTLVLNIFSIAYGLPLVLHGLDPYENGGPAWFVGLQVGGGSIWFAAELATMLLNSKRRAIHDFMARSIVVKLSVYRGGAHDEAAGA
jgi:uncharacterized RDD family membrane protein YckC